MIAGKRDELMGKIQESYGITKDETEKQIKDFEERNKDDRSWCSADPDAVAQRQRRLRRFLNPLPARLHSAVCADWPISMSTHYGKISWLG